MNGLTVVSGPVPETLRVGDLWTQIKAEQTQNRKIFIQLKGNLTVQITTVQHDKYKILNPQTDVEAAKVRL